MRKSAPFLPKKQASRPSTSLDYGVGVPIRPAALLFGRKT